MLGECQVNVKSQSELDIGGRKTCVSSFLALSQLSLSSLSCPEITHLMDEGEVLPLDMLE